MEFLKKILILTGDYIRKKKNFDQKDHDKLLVSVTTPQIVSMNSVKLLLNKVKSSNYVMSHIPFDKNFNKYLIDNKWKIIFTYRDPRDMCASMLKHIEGRPHHYAYNYLFRNLKTTSDRLRAIVNGFQNENNKKIISIKNMYSIMMHWKHEKNVLAFKYEDMVGIQGNGNSLEQSNAIKKILKSLNVSEYNEGLINYISKNSYGKSNTFRKGQIGNWKKVFNNEDCVFLNKNTESLLTELNYKLDY